MSLNALTAQAIGRPNSFNWPWFVELVVCGIIVLFFLFYFNRLFATLLSYGIRAYAWHHYRVWVDIQALQISLLGGRIFFKEVRYHGENETIIVHNGYLTWRYWFRNIRHVDLTFNGNAHDKRQDGTNTGNTSDDSSRMASPLDEERGTPRKQDNSEARIAIFITGLEWFIYNRTPMYDAILRADSAVTTENQNANGTSTGVTSSDALKAHLRSKFRRRPKSDEMSSSEESATKVDYCEKSPSLGETVSHSGHKHSVSITETGSAEDDVTTAQSLLVRLLPLYVECSRVAVSIGNENTRAMIVATVERAKGHVDARGCGPHDLFQQLFEFNIEHPVVQMRPNPDFVGTQLTVAERIIIEPSDVATKKNWGRWRMNVRRRKQRAVHALRNLIPGFRSSVESLHHSDDRLGTRSTRLNFADIDFERGEWHGLSRYLDEDDTDDHQAWSHIDYARFSTILDCPSVHMSFYWDTPGRVKNEHLAAGDARDFQGINGVEAPGYGLDLIVRGGTINYGPWADRLRAEIQSVFFPASYRSATPASRLKAGQWRQSTAMVIRVDIEEEVTMRVPTRENSKDWRWRGRTTAVRDAAVIKKQRQKKHFRLRRGPKSLAGPDIRPFGWMSFSVSPDSTVRYDMDMVAGQHGYDNQLQLDLRNTKATSSVNHADLWRCAGQRLQCDLSNPLVWNAQHTWRFNIQNHAMDMFLLRDHMFLLTDLIADFTAGPKGDYMTFVPFEYKIALRFDDLKLFLNANDYNIIDNPCDIESNAFLVLGMHQLDGNVSIPMKYFSPSQSSVHFQAHGNNLFLDLKTPVWNTIHSFAQDENMATLKKLGLSGSYNYNAGTSPQLTDSLFMDIVGGSPKFHLQGFLIRYFMNVKENYFGEDLHFRTLEEYQSRLGPDNRLLPDDQKRPVKKENDLDVVLNVRAEDSCALMPTNIYEREEYLRVDVMLIEADMRFTNYYMDLQVNSSPVEVSLETVKTQNGQGTNDRTSCQLYISTVSVFGHRLFGAPPTEPTYVCNWDFDVGFISGECSTTFLRVAIAAIQAFIFTFDDDENALPITRDVVLDDVTFLRARVDGTQVWLRTDVAAFLLETGAATISFNDWAGNHFSKTLRADVPYILAAVIDLQSNSRRQGSLKQQCSTLACIQTSLQVVNIDKKADFENQRLQQQNHVKFHDLRTSRASCLLHDRRPMNLSAKEIEWGQEPPAMPVPDLPAPAVETIGSHTRLSSRQRNRNRSSFLDSSSTSSFLDHEPGSSHRKSHVTGVKEARDATFHLQNGKYVKDPGSFTDAAGSTAVVDKNAAFSSPWIQPQFVLQKVRPDMSQMPCITSIMAKTSHQSSNPSGAEYDYNESDEELPHAAIFCNLIDGLRGFCTPSLFPVIVEVLQGIAPKGAHAILDAIQYSTFTGLKSLTTEKSGEKIDFTIKIPAAAIRFIDNGHASKQPSDLLGDQYDFVISHTRFNGRVAPTVTRQSHGQTKSSIFLVQASIREMSLLAAERMKSGVHDAAQVRVSISEIEFWLSSQDAVRAKLQLSRFGVSTGGSTVDRLSMLVERCIAMTNDIIEEFAKLDQVNDVQHLAYHLTLTADDTADPIFLIKPSYVLRSAAEHVRLADSWKAVSRLRQKLLSLTREEQARLIDHKSCTFIQQQETAREQILNFVDHAKSWDRTHEACGPILAAIFGQPSNTEAALSKIEDFEVGAYLGQVSIILDPGPQQSELRLSSADFNFAQKPIFERNVEPQDGDMAPRSRVRVQVWFADVTLDVNWSLIELARSLVKQINASAAVAEVSNRRRSSAPTVSSRKLDLMVVAGTDIATAKIRTVNLTFRLAAQQLETSVIVQLSGMRSTSSLLLASSTAQLKLASQHRKLFAVKMRTPSVYGQCQQNPRSLKSSDTARLAASCDQLRFVMKEDVLSCLEVVESVIKDEVSIIQEVVDSIEQSHVTVPSSPRSASMSLDDIHVAFFLKDYKLHLCLLPSLYYSIAGMVARTSIVPLHMSRYAVHVDIKKNRHTLIEPNSNIRHSAATLEIPPVSGRFIIGLAEGCTQIDARIVMERVTIEASAVQACIEAAYKPQNVAQLKNGKIVLQKLQLAVNQLNSKTNESAPATKTFKAESKKTVLYSGHAVLEGLDVRCSAPGANEQDYRVDLKFGIHETTLRIHNYHKSRKIPIDQPHFEVNLRQVFLGLYRQERHNSRNYGRFNMGLRLSGTTQPRRDGDHTRNYRLQSENAQLDLFSETAALVIDMAVFLQNRITEITTVEDRQKIRPLRRLTLANNDAKAASLESQHRTSEVAPSSNFLDTTFSLDLNAIRIRWIVADDLHTSIGRTPEDLVFSIRQIDLKTQQESSARLTILDTQLQTVPKNQTDPTQRSSNSALLPEMIFSAAHFSTKHDRRFAFQAAGKALDLRLAADGILPLSTVQRSLARVAADLRSVNILQTPSAKSTGAPTTNILGNKRLASLLVDADFAGAVIKISPRVEKEPDMRDSAFGLLKGPKRSKAGRYGQAVQTDSAQEAILRAPGIAFKVEYLDTGSSVPTLSTEVKVAASSNTLAPSVVPLVLEIYSSVKEIIGDDTSGEIKEDDGGKASTQQSETNTTITETDPTAILGRVKLNADLWVQKQEFSLTCQPIARVAATAKFDEIFVTINTVHEGSQERFFSIITTFNKLQASVQHVYSRESTASFEVESIVMSLMNSKHVSEKNGISAILNVSPMKGSLNAKQMQDFLLFREIWYPAELRHQSKPTAPVVPASESQAYAMQKYHELAATAALPWNAIVSIQELRLEVDFGQSLGKSSFMVYKLWASSKKNSDWEQNLCVGFERIGIDSSGRMSGFVELKQFRARTSIRWPVSKDSGVRAPLVQASVGFGHLRLKTAFDYQPFAVADVSSFEFLMYNVRPTQEGDNDRLVGVLDGGKVQVFCISAAAAQALSIVQAFERLFQEKRDAFQESLHELDKLLRRKSIFPSVTNTADASIDLGHVVASRKRESHRLHTDVVVTLGAIDIGAFPNTFFDNQILKIEAADVQARFAVAMIENRIRSGLGMTLGQVRVALSSVSRPNTKALGEVEIGEVIERATSSRGGTILKVPRLVASMQTWQKPHSNTVEYIFTSTFQGKVDVGWNYSRIRFIRGMWETHSQALAHRLGKPLPPAAVKITAEPQKEGLQEAGQEKITAVVNVPQSTKFQYVALEPPVIDTPQLRDMGEATPPLEWIGLHRDKLPNVTHSIVIVTLIEVAKEVEEAYTRILGTG